MKSLTDLIEEAINLLKQYKTSNAIDIVIDCKVRFVVERLENGEIVIKEVL